MRTRSFFIAAGLGAALFIYGYTLSTVGHDHSSHSAEDQTQTDHVHDYDDHDHH